MSDLTIKLNAVSVSLDGTVFTPAIAAEGLLAIATLRGSLGRQTVREGREFVAAVAACVNVNTTDADVKTRACNSLRDACADLSLDFTIQSRKGLWSVVDRAAPKAPEQREADKKAADAAAAAAETLKLQNVTAAAVSNVNDALARMTAERDMLSETLARVTSERDAAVAELSALRATLAKPVRAPRKLKAA